MANYPLAWWGCSASSIPFPYCSSDPSIGQVFCKGLWFSHWYWFSWLKDLGLLLTVWNWERDRVQGILPREEADIYFIHLPVFGSDFGCSWCKRDWKVMKYLGGKSQVQFRTWMCDSEEEQDVGRSMCFDKELRGWRPSGWQPSCFSGHGLVNRACAKKEPMKKDGG